MSNTTTFEAVTVNAKANIYFDGKVISHSVWFKDGSKKTLGLIYPGTYHFNTEAPEQMDIISGNCNVKIADAPEWLTITANQHFEIPANSSFEIEVSNGICEYVCSFK